MFENLQVFRMSDAMARHAGSRQTVIAQNVANADTPGYRARDIVPFADTVSSNADAFAQRATRASHLSGNADGATIIERVDTTATQAPNGNSVEIEDQMLKAVDVERQHDRALAIYRNAMTIMRLSLGRG